MLKCKNVCKSYGEKQVVDNLSFNVERGKVFAFLGSNGAGKTTTIKMILGLTGISSGEIEVSEGVTIGYSPETPYFPPFLNGYEVLEYYAGIQGIPKANQNEEITHLLDLVGLTQNKVKVKHYSKGMLQRLALAQALLGNPDLLILDEPTAGLDALGRTEMMELIRSLKKKGKTILINSHILNDVERVCDEGIIIRLGKTVGTWNKNDTQNKSLEELFISLVGGEE